MGKQEEPKVVEGSFIMESKDKDPRSINIIFSLTEAIGALAEALKIFKEQCELSAH